MREPTVIYERPEMPSRGADELPLYWVIQSFRCPSCGFFSDEHPVVGWDTGPGPLGPMTERELRHPTAIRCAQCGEGGLLFDLRIWERPPEEER